MSKFDLDLALQESESRNFDIDTALSLADLPEDEPSILGKAKSSVADTWDDITGQVNDEQEGRDRQRLQILEQERAAPDLTAQDAEYLDSEISTTRAKLPRESRGATARWEPIDQPSFEPLDVNIVPTQVIDKLQGNNQPKPDMALLDKQGFMAAQSDLLRRQKLQKDIDKLAAIRRRAPDANETTVRAMQNQEAVSGKQVNPGSVSKSGFDFDTAREYKGSGTITRGAAKGGDLLAKQVLGLHEAAADLIGADDYSAWTRTQREQLDRRDAAIGDRGDYLTKNWEGAVTSIVSQGPGLVLSVASGGSIPLIMMGAQVFGDEYSQGKAAGLDKSDAANRAGLYGVAEIVGERIGMPTFLKFFKASTSGMPTDELVKELGKHIAREVPGEQLTTALQFGTDKFAEFGLNKNSTLDDYIAQARDTLVQTVMQAGAMGATGAAINYPMARNKSRETNVGDQAQASAGATFNRYFGAFNQPTAGTQDTPLPAFDTTETDAPLPVIELDERNYPLPAYLDETVAKPALNSLLAEAIAAPNADAKFEITQQLDQEMRSLLADDLLTDFDLANEIDTELQTLGAQTDEPTQQPVISTETPAGQPAATTETTPPTPLPVSAPAGVAQLVADRETPVDDTQASQNEETSRQRAEERYKEIISTWGSKSYGKTWKPTTPLEIKVEAESLRAILTNTTGAAHVSPEVVTPTDAGQGNQPQGREAPSGTGQASERTADRGNTGGLGAGVEPAGAVSPAGQERDALKQPLAMKYSAAVNYAKQSANSGIYYNVLPHPTQAGKFYVQATTKDAQLQIPAKDTATVQAPQPAAKPEEKKVRPSDNLITRIKQLGGINTRYRSDVLSDNKGGPVGLFSNTGKGLDDLATELQAEGFDIDIADVDGGVESLTTLVQDAIAGRTVLNFQGQGAATQADQTHAYRQQLIADIEKMGGTARRNAQTKRLEEQRAALQTELNLKGQLAAAEAEKILGNVLTDADWNAILELPLAELDALDFEIAAQHEVEHGRTTEEEADYWRGRQETRGSPVESAEGSTRQSAEAGRTEPRTQEPQALALTGQTPEEVKAEEARLAAIKEQEAYDRAIDNAMGDTFILTGSKRAADELAARGQGDIFSQPSATRSKPKTRISFDGITGPTGAKLTGYEWAWKPYAYVDRLGEDREGRESDWDNAETNVETGRDIVHKFTVAQAGNEQTVSLETALQLLGFAEAGSLSVKGVANTAKRVAKIKMAIAELEPVADAYDKAKAEVDAIPHPEVVDDGSGWKRMGTAKVRWMKDSDDAERMRVLKDAWRNDRMNERGFKSYAKTPHQVIAELNDKLARAERKLADSIKAAQSEGSNPPAKVVTEGGKQAEAKEPWQMTREMYSAHLNDAFKYETPSRNALDYLVKNGAIGSGGAITVTGKQIKNAAQKYEIFESDLKKLDTIYGAVTKLDGVDQYFVAKRDMVTSMNHRGKVESALLSGKPVPAEVLDDYPDLQSKQQTKAVNNELTTGWKKEGEQGRIEDFGEKLGGARKDLAEAMAKEYSDDEIASLPLSKVWPTTEVDAIEDKYIAAVAFASRQEVPAKPRVAYKVAAWVNKIKAYRGFMRDLVNGKISVEKHREQLKKWKPLEGFYAKVTLLENIDRDQWKRIGKVSEHPDSYTYDADGNKVPVPQVLVDIDGRRERFVGTGTISEVIDKVNEKLGGEVEAKRMQFEVRGLEGAYFINKAGDSLYRKLKTFGTTKEAIEYRNSHYDDLVAAWDAVKASDNVKETDVRRPENRPRTAKDWRNGKDATPEQFEDGFGFRGVEFGNWVSQGKNPKERQGMLNQAYDALMDLSNIVGVPPKAMSLNGSLGLGFGSRGHGWASAHFEPNTLVINLTKTRGAGALAHEWFHAMDNYFQRERIAKGETSKRLSDGHSGDFITYAPENYYVNTTQNNSQKIPEREFARMVKHNPARFSDMSKWKLIEGVRPEVGEAFSDLVKALNDSPMAKRASLIDKGKSGGYWSRIIERGARSFENYVIHKMMLKGYSNDYLANVTSIEDFARDPGRYPYLLEGEIQPVADAFDNLFATIKTKETDKGVAMFSRAQWYSPLAKAIQTAKQDTMPAQQWKLWLLGNKAKLGLKDDEIQWSGITDYLDLRGKDKVTKAEIADYFGNKSIRPNEGIALFQRVWHGTPHLWNPEPGFPHGRPRLDKQGTGEGGGVPGAGAAYGYGFYIAEAKEVGASYRNTLAGRDGTPEGYAAHILATYNGSIEKARKYLTDILPPKGETTFNGESRELVQGAIDALDSGEYKKADNGSLYQLDIPDDVLPYLLDWDKPLSQQTAEVRKALAKAGVVDFDKNIGPSATGEVRDLGWAKNVGSLRGEEIYKRIVEGNFGKASEVTSSARKASEKAASEYLASIGIVGNRYLDGQSRNRPLKNIKREFLAELPEDADTSEVADLIGTGKFSPKNDALLRALKNNDWLGFDYPAQAVSAVLSKDISGYDASPALIRAVEDAKEGGTYNFVIWDQPTLDRIALLERNGEKLNAIREAQMSRGAGKGMALRDLKAVATRVKVANRNMPEIHVYESPASLDLSDPVQKRLYDYIEAAGAMNDVEGATHEGEIYAFASNLSDEARAEHVLTIHELTHYGLRGVFGSGLDPILQSIWLQNPSLQLKAAQARKTLGLASNVEAIEEVLADLTPAELVKLKGWRKLVQFIRDWFREHGFTATADKLDNLIQFGMDDQAKADLLVADVVNAARDWVKNGRSGRIGNVADTKLAKDAAKDTFVGAMFSRSGQPSGRDTDSRFSRNADPVWSTEPISKMDTFLYEVTDKQVDTKRVIEAIKKQGSEIADKWNTYIQEALYHGRTAKKTDDFLHDEAEPLIKKMADAGVTQDDLNDYLHARHAIERNRVMKERNPDRDDNDGLSGMSDEAANAILAKTTPALKDIAKDVDAILRKTRAWLVAYGLEKQETVDAWSELYEHYVPLKREGFEQRPGTGMGFAVRGSSTKEATGSHRAVDNILANVAMQRERAIVRGEKNRVALSLYGLAKQFPNSQFWKLDKPAQITQINPETGMPEVVAGDMADYKVPRVKYIGTDGTVQERVDPNYKGRNNVLTARINGEDRAIIFNEQDPRALRMVESLKNLDADQLGEILGGIGQVTRYIASVNTQYNPVFGVINLMRDVQTAALNLSSTELKGKQKEVLSQSFSALKGVYQDARAVRNGKHPTSSWSKLWEEFQSVGGQTGYRQMFATSKDRADAIESLLDPEWWQKSKVGKVVTLGGILAKPEQLLFDKVGRHVFHWLSDYNLAMENGVRLAAYKVGIENGMSKEKAAFLAKNLTVNFNKKGRIATQAGAMYAFFNASAQGTARIAETLTAGAKDGEYLGKVGKQIVYGGITLGAMQVVALMMAGFDEDEPPEFVRERNLIIPTPGTEKGYVTIPMPLGFHVLPNIGRTLVEGAVYGKPLDRITDLLMTMLEAFNPIGTGASMAQTIAPTVFDPVVALSENKDWTGKAIYREDFSKNNPTPGFTRTKDSASMLSKGIAYGINAITGGTDYTPGRFSPTPDQIDYIIGQVTGGVGREATKAMTTAESLITGEDLPTYKIPLVGRLVGTSADNAAISERFYDNVRMLNSHEAEIKGRREKREPTLDYIRDNPESRLVRLASTTETEVRVLQKRKKKLAEEGNREAVKLVDMQIAAKMRRLNDRVSEIQK